MLARRDGCGWQSWCCDKTVGSCVFPEVKRIVSYLNAVVLERLRAISQVKSSQLDFRVRVTQNLSCAVSTTTRWLPLCSSPLMSPPQATTAAARLHQRLVRHPLRPLHIIQIKRAQTKASQTLLLGGLDPLAQDPSHEKRRGMITAVHHLRRLAIGVRSACTLRLQ
jgi:hypothetical protein